MDDAVKPQLTKRQVLAETSFGQRIAEEESEALRSYFVETDQWRQVLSGKVDIVYGAKGSGKRPSAAALRKCGEE